MKREIRARELAARLDSPEEPFILDVREPQKARNLVGGMTAWARLLDTTRR